DLFGIAVLGQAGEAHEVGEHDGDHAAFVAVGLQGMPTGRAEPRIGRGLGSAVRAIHRLILGLAAQEESGSPLSGPERPPLKRGNVPRERVKVTPRSPLTRHPAHPAPLALSAGGSMTTSSTLNPPPTAE